MQPCIRKISEKNQRSRLENWMYRYAVNPVLPFFSQNFSANAVTGMGLLAGLGSVYAAYTRNYIPAAVLSLLKTWLDYIDGPVARCTGTTSQLGDWLDHLSDWAFYIPMGLLLFSRVPCKCIYSVTLGVIVLGFLVQFGCQERFSNASNNSPSTQWTQMLCPSRRVQEIVQGAELNDVTLSLFYATVLLCL